MSDITIGDFWGIEKINHEFKDDYGVSVIIAHSKKGEVFFSEIEQEFDCFEAKLENVVTNNPNLCNATPCPSSRNKFWKDYNKGFDYIVQKYGGNSFSSRLKRIIYKLIVKFG